MKKGDILNIENAMCNGFISQEQSTFQYAVKIGERVKFNSGTSSNPDIKEGEYVSFINGSKKQTNGIEKAKKHLNRNDLPNNRFHDFNCFNDSMIIKVIEGNRGLEHYYAINSWKIEEVIIE